MGKLLNQNMQVICASTFDTQISHEVSLKSKEQLLRITWTRTERTLYGWTEGWAKLRLYAFPKFPAASKSLPSNNTILTKIAIGKVHHRS